MQNYYVEKQACLTSLQTIINWFDEHYEDLTLKQIHRIKELEGEFWLILERRKHGRILPTQKQA